MNKNNNPSRRPSQSLGRLSEVNQPTYSSEDHESDLEMRQSPKPTLSTNRISKSKSQQEASFRLLPQSHMFSDYNQEALFSSDREAHHTQMDSILSDFVANWRILTLPQLETLSHLREQAHNINSQHTLIKLDFLIALWEMTNLRRKIVDIRLNLGVLEVQLQTKPTTDRNKMLVLEILEKKLTKKLLFVALRFNRLLIVVQATMKTQRLTSAAHNHIEIEDNIEVSFVDSRKLIQFEILLNTLSKIILNKLSVALKCIKKSVFIDNLFSPGSEEYDQEELEHRHMSPSALQLTLSPNNFLEGRRTEKSSAKHPSNIKSTPLPSLYEQAEPQQSSKEQFLSLQVATAKDVTELYRLIIGLERDVKAVNNHFRQDRTAKQKELYFNRWKIMFLRRYLDRTIKQYFNSCLLRKTFGIWRLPYANYNEPVKIEEGTELEGSDTPKRRYDEQSRLLKLMFKKRNLRLFVRLVGEIKDTKKIFGICRSIYKKNLQAKVLYGLLIEKQSRANLPRSDHNVRNQGRHISQPYGQITQIVEQRNQREQDYPYIDYSQQEIGQQQEQPYHMVTTTQTHMETTAAQVFYQNNLLTKTFMQLKRYYQCKSIIRSINIFIKRFAFNKLLQTSLIQDRLHQKLSRQQKQKELSTKFKCFSTLKKNHYGKTPKSSVGFYIQSRNNVLMERYFLVWKLIWKMRLIKQKKADKLHEFHNHIKVFSAFKSYASGRVAVSKKMDQLVDSLYCRRSMKFMRNLIRNYLEQRQLNKKTETLKCLVFDRQTQRIQDFLQFWKKYALKQRNFERVIGRLRRLKDKQTKTKIFQLWWQQVYGTPRPMESTSLTSLPTEPSPELTLSGQHRYWLERYYSKLLSK